jgi:hypothetical protein
MSSSSSASSFDMCLQITQQFIDRALNVFFLQPVDPEIDGLPDYHSKIRHPMDLTTVKTKLQTNTYNSTTQWYRDMCLIYENAIKYHGESTLWGSIASQLLHDFKRAATGFQTQSNQEWSDLLATGTKKLGKLITSSPVKHGADVLISSCIHRAEGLPKFSRDAISDLVGRLNPLLDRDEVRSGLISIIKLTQKEPPITTNDDESVLIDVEKLKDHTLHAIQLFVKAVE